MNHLSITWSTSRGRDTYGYNICRLDSRATGKRYRTCGGGYDMTGTVVGEWLEAEHQPELQALAARVPLEDCNYAVPGYRRPTREAGLYGLTIRPDGSVSLDGACGIRSMEIIAEAIGLRLGWLGNRKGHTTGYFISKGDA